LLTVYSVSETDLVDSLEVFSGVAAYTKASCARSCAIVPPWPFWLPIGETPEHIAHGVGGR
jgi:hypothetical protein